MVPTPCNYFDDLSRDNHKKTFGIGLKVGRLVTISRGHGSPRFRIVSGSNTYLIRWMVVDSGNKATLGPLDFDLRLSQKRKPG